MIELGAIVRPKKMMIPRNEQALGRTYKLKELENKPEGQASGTPYLPDDTLQYIYLRHSSSKNRHFFTLSIDPNREIDFIVVNPATQQRNQNQVNLATVYQQALEEEDPASGLAEMFADWQVVNQHFEKELSAALKHIDLRLKDYKEHNKKGTLIVLQSSKTAEQLSLAGLTTLLNDFPVLKLPLAQGFDFPPLEWIKFACKRTIATHPEAILTV